MSLSSKLRHLGIVVQDPRWWPFYMQRRVMSPRRRQALASVVVRSRPSWSRTGRAVSLSESESLLAELAECGLAPLGRMLTHEECAALVDYFHGCAVEDPYRPELGSFAPDSPNRPPESHVAYHEARDTVSAPGLLSLANQPRLLNVAARFLGCKPTIAYMAAWWSYPTAVGAQQAERFHRDVDDWRFLKLFVYLTDVGLDNGPHVYVTTSASSDQLAQIRRFTDEEVATVFGLENVRTLTGTAGEGFLENTFGIHKGLPVKLGKRLIFQVVYSLFELPYGPKKPLSISGSIAQANPNSLDPWINRVYLGKV